MATLEVNRPPGFSKDFSPAELRGDGISVLTIVVDNTTSTANANDLALVDDLPAGVMVAEPANVTSTCVGGSVTVVPGTDQVVFRGGSVPAGVTCMISLDVAVTVRRNRLRLIR